MISYATYLHKKPIPVCSTIYGKPLDVIPPPPKKTVDWGEYAPQKNYPKTRKANPPKVKRGALGAEVRAEIARKRKEREIAARKEKYSFMRGKGWMTTTQIANLRGVENNTVNRTMDFMIADGVVERKNEGALVFYRWLETRKSNQ